MSSETQIKKRRKISYLPTLMSIAMVIFMLGLLGIILITGRNLGAHLKEHFQITVFLAKDADPAKQNAILQQIQQAEYTKSAKLVSKEDAARQFTSEIGEDFVSFLGFNPLLPSIEFFVKSRYAQPDRIMKIDTELRRNKDVVEVVYQKSIIEELNKNLKTIGGVMVGLCVIFLIIAITLINNTIRLNLYAMRFIIKSMQMVGATHGFIIRPFVFRSFLYGLAGSVLAIILLIALLSWLPYYVDGIEVIYNRAQFAFLFVVIILAGLVISMLSSWISTNHYLKMKIDDLY